MNKPDTARVLRELKPFQRDTVDQVFSQMYERQPASHRYLVADEVGLGKTLVARGIMARMIDRFWDVPDHRIDVVYICSNSGIARQNLNKLNFFGKVDQAIPDRITMLPQVLKDLEHQKLNLVSFTPGTSFNLGSSEGRAYERALMYWLLPDDWREQGGPGAITALMGGVRERSRFEQYIKESKGWRIDATIREEFEQHLERKGHIKSGFLNLCASLSGRARTLDEAERRERAGIVGNLRALLAETCVLALQPDLVILDEFQRFRDLLYGSDPASDLARQLFTFTNVRVLLLSATPYKMYTLHEEAEEDHYEDFVKTVGFLLGDPGVVERFKADLTDYRQAIFQWSPGDGVPLRAARQRVEHALKRVMVRTERLASSADRNGMLVEVPPAASYLRAHDIQRYGLLQQVAGLVGAGDVMEFWKSAPYVLNFMDDYDLKERFRDAADRSDVARRIAAIFQRAPSSLLSWEDIEAYRQIDPANARLRQILASTVDRGTSHLLWMPPALPYYRLGKPFDIPDAATLTKYLVFSSWLVVPKVVSSLVSYEAERALVTAADGRPAFDNTLEARKKAGRLLRFSRSRGRLTGMPVAALLYPSESLSGIGDPLAIASELHGSAEAALPTLNDVLAQVRSRLSPLLEHLPSGLADGAPDESWYWAAPLLLDLQAHPSVTRTWFAQADLAARWIADVPEGEPETTPGPSQDGDEEPHAWQGHVDEFRRILRGELHLGPRPTDLVDTLALLAVAGPGNAALRALRRQGAAVAAHATDCRNAAGRVAAGLRSLFNDPAVTAFVRSPDPDVPYWRRVLHYCADGCLQSVLDEYVHLLGDCGGRRGMKATEFIGPIVDALTLFSATVTVDQIGIDAETGGVVVSNAGRAQASTSVEGLGQKRLRTNFAARYGAQRRDDGGGAERNRRLQAAFNSPFWPFVLCSTSIGQEGLDFHYYCHAVVHWNLPSNPVDLEQREGRVHRYKGHAVRKNVAQQYGLREQGPGQATDPWRQIFRAAIRDGGQPDGGLTPYWLYTTEGGARIERHIPAVPLSLDRARAEALRRSLALYRMAFGQARQEDVVAFLQRFPPEQLATAADDLRIDLSPAPSTSGSHLVVEAAGEVVGSPVEDEEPMWFGGSDDTLPDSSFGAMEHLLDRFAELRAQAAAIAEEVAPASAPELADLLDRFVALTSALPKPDGVEDAPAQATAATLEAMQSLLDEFASLRSSTQPVDPVPQLQRLLDEFAQLLRARHVE